MPTVALYARVSTADQDPERQLEELREHARRNYLDAETEPYVDVISGTEDGEEFKRLQEDIADGLLDTVVRSLLPTITDPDRMIGGKSLRTTV